MKRFLRTGSFLALAALLSAGPALAQAPNDTARESRQNGETNASPSATDQAARAAVEASLLGTYQPWVDYRDGKISVAFNEAPVVAALSAFRDKTGFEIILPAAADQQLLNLHLTGLPLEPAVRSLIQSIGFSNFALMYDKNGQPSRAIVIAPPPGNDPNPGAEAATKPGQADAAAQPLTPEEREKLQKQLELWSELNQEVRGRIEDRLKSLPPSEEREQLVKEYGRQVLGIKN